MPTSFIQEQIFSPIGVRPHSDQLRTAVTTPEILGHTWTLELQRSTTSEMAQLFVRAPAVYATGDSGSTAPDMLTLQTSSHESQDAVLPSNLSAPASWHTINIYEFGLNRDLCLDPRMASAPPSHESNMALLHQGTKSTQIDRVGRRFLATVKRALTGLMDNEHPPQRIMDWSGAAAAGTSSLANPHIAAMSLSLATLNRLNHSHYLDPPFPGLTLGTIAMLNHMQVCMEEAIQSGVQGDLLEAGVWRGGQTVLMRAVLEAIGDQNRSVWVLDSFSGIPKPSETTSDAGKDETLDWQPGQYQASLESVKANFARFDLLDDRVHFLQGNFRDTLPGFQPPKLAVLRLDADTYEATVQLLDHLYHNLADGGYVIIDDFHLNGARRAVLEFRARHNINDAILPVPEDYVFACGQHHSDYFHTWPKKIPQGAYWKKGGFGHL